MRPRSGGTALSASTSSNTRRRQSTRRSAEQRTSLPSDLHRFLLGLAQLLVPAGVTPGYFNVLATHAFVEAAGLRSKCRNGRVNQSRVAVLTGLRRHEIGRILDVDPHSLAELHRPR